MRDSSTLGPTVGASTCVSVTCTDGLDHLVPEAAVAEATNGRYPARCGDVVTPDSMSAPAGHNCPLCHSRLAPPVRGRRR